MLLNRQKLFDKVATHLLTQNEKAEGDNGCMYRAPNGFCCAIGCIIPDDKYSADLEEHGLYESIVEVVVLQIIRKDAYELATELQKVHDEYEPDEWLHKLRKTAGNWKLDASALDNFGV